MSRAKEIAGVVHERHTRIFQCNAAYVDSRLMCEQAIQQFAREMADEFRLRDAVGPAKTAFNVAARVIEREAGIGGGDER